MISFEKTEIVGIEHAIRGMRNPKNSWDRQDSGYTLVDDYRGVYEYKVGPKDLELAKGLAKAGPVHAKYRRMIVVYVDITAPLYWWKEFDTYKVGTVANSCSTMHKIHAKEFTLDDFSTEHLFNGFFGNENYDFMKMLIDRLEANRKTYLALDGDEKEIAWWQMIQLLPTSYNQKRTVMLNYEVLANIYKWRNNHKLDEWRDFCEWIESLEYSELITMVEGGVTNE